MKKYGHEVTYQTPIDEERKAKMMDELTSKHIELRQKKEKLAEIKKDLGDEIKELERAKNGLIISVEEGSETHVEMCQMVELPEKDERQYINKKGKIVKREPLAGTQLHI